MFATDISIWSTIDFFAATLIFTLMQAALLQRFQGALLGATLGEFLSLPNQVLGDRSSWPLEPARLTAQLPMSELMWHYAQILAESGQVAGRVDEASGSAHR